MDDSQQQDYYSLLGVEPTATLDQIRRAYRQQVARYHPDRFVDATAREQIAASRHVQRINEAYRVLSNQRLRATYNSTLGIDPPGASAATLDDLNRLADAPRPRRTPAPPTHPPARSIKRSCTSGPKPTSKPSSIRRRLPICANCKS